ncbi:hypothetical protein [Tepidibacter hydrothermalis]|uniref:Uncharacterized protein n=1 Tax=Tepidibacter hydrothermalis TaxID=3036126 RepID=A0ABY8EL32_9FIRM|nr:hypothetical protein [Tepidibacter hydrothermalis]WFD11953.1 hypothetical protein P4S50_07715 [Tepidibacter hydrothermalis]
MRKKRYFQNHYNYDKSNNTYLIKVSLDDYDDIYDDWDPSPFKKRDIEDEFNDFIVNSSEDIPLNFNIQIVLHLPEYRKDVKKEVALLSAYKNYYSYAIERLTKNKLNLHKKTLSYLFLSILFLSMGYLFIKDIQNVFLNILHEGIYIGGWVFLWEFFTNIFITTREVQTEYNIYKRLYQSEVKFIYK